ncbi:hypothetical protein [Desulfobacca acetoxidans]|uniref:HepT-like domain-containing protein n=1 Tax=Desulfobacca acetoxidans (strain ATCC 700848 / DSM 11109 / ASRB2) TaxID=880072 RepID=F2NCU9_DESAR|nr:hypothetical protein [Desulfobacca acetoxidans]AEB09380.1 hypothetical protein Desac_1525 [Desulfobacca acetoxidans DSM 11109]
MREISSDALREMANDLEVELDRLERLNREIVRVQGEIKSDSARADLFYENLALKLHNFYTGCERIFQIIASELNGALPSGYDWHKRLLSRMSLVREGRPAILSVETARQLDEFLAFRHVVRNNYGFELNPHRLEELINKYPAVYHEFEVQVRNFVKWLLTLAKEIA